MATAAEIRREKKQETIGLAASVFLLLSAPKTFLLEKTFAVSGWDAILWLGACLGILCVLFYNRNAGKNFWHCMYLSLTPVMAVYLALGILFVVSMIVAVAMKGPAFAILPALILFTYYGGPVYLWMATIAFATASCVGGALAFAALRINKLFAETRRPQWQ